MYLLDANVFIQAHRQYYAFPICPGFWQSLLHHHHNNQILSVDRVRLELLKGDDALSDWILKQTPTTLFAPTHEPTVVQAFSEMMTWAQQSGQFSDKALADFAAAADGWLVAYAHANGHMVVTHETFNKDAKNRIKIPNVCRQFNVPYQNTFEMLAELKVSYHWSLATAPPL